MVRRRLKDTSFGIQCWFFCVLTVLSLASLVAWLSLIPKTPCFGISVIYFPGIDFKNYSTHPNVSIAHNSVIFDIEILNPNKHMGIYYSGIGLNLYSSGAVIGTNSTPPFYQGYKNTMEVKILIHANQGFWQGTNGGNIGFITRVETIVRFQIMKWKTKPKMMEYEAHFSNARMNLNGTVSGGNYTEQHDAYKIKTRS